MIKEHKRFYNEDENGYNDVEGTVEGSKESENFDDDHEDGDGDGYDVDYKKTNQTK